MEAAQLATSLLSEFTSHRERDGPDPLALPGQGEEELYATMSAMAPLASLSTMVSPVLFSAPVNWKGVIPNAASKAAALLATTTYAPASSVKAGKVKSTAVERDHPSMSIAAEPLLYSSMYS